MVSIGAASEIHMGQWQVIVWCDNHRWLVWRSARGLVPYKDLGRSDRFARLLDALGTSDELQPR
jgi:hypothetical protein